MKKLIILLFVLGAISVNAQKQSKVHGFMSYGADTDSGYNFTKIQIEYHFKYKDLAIIPFTLQKAWFEPSKDVFKGAKPFRHVYKVGIRFEYKNIFLEAHHYCSHIVSGDYDVGSEQVYIMRPKKMALNQMDEMNVGGSNIIEIGFKF